mgnify:CR=1 FL=1
MSQPKLQAIALAVLLGATEMDVREHRKRRAIVATYKAVDTCAARAIATIARSTAKLLFAAGP